MALHALVTARCHCRQPEDRDGCASPSLLLSLFLPREESVRSSLLQSKDGHSSAENTLKDVPFSGEKVMSQMTLLRTGKTLVYLKCLFKESKGKKSGSGIFFFLLSLSP